MKNVWYAVDYSIGDGTSQEMKSDSMEGPKWADRDYFRDLIADTLGVSRGSVHISHAIKESKL